MLCYSPSLSGGSSIVLRLSSFVVLGLPACVVILSLQSLGLRFSAGLHELHPLSVCHIRGKTAGLNLSSGLFSGTRKRENPLGEISPGCSGLLPNSPPYGTGPYLPKLFSLAMTPTWRLTLCHCCLAQEQMEEHQERMSYWPLLQQCPRDRCVSCP